jgi:holo-[acyl-carrier protein] synthase
MVGTGLPLILALGADLVEVARVRRLLARHGERALKRLFHEEELAHALARQDPAPSLAARLAAKEAFQKCWPESLSWKSVWVGMEGKKPFLRFAPALEAAMREQGLLAHLTLSHERTHALAVVVLVRAPGAG